MSIIFFLLCFCALVMLFYYGGTTSPAKPSASGSGARWLFRIIFLMFVAVYLYQASWQLAGFARPAFMDFKVSIIKEIMRGSLIDPSMVSPRKTSAMIVDATKPLDRPFSPVSKCPDDALARIKLEDYVPGEVLQHIPMDRTTYWA